MRLWPRRGPCHRTLDKQRITGLRLEEIESDKIHGDDVWLITLSAISNTEPTLSAYATAIMGSKVDRDYKVFTVRKSDGEIIAMKIREFAAA